MKNSKKYLLYFIISLFIFNKTVLAEEYKGNIVLETNSTKDQEENKKFIKLQKYIDNTDYLNNKKEVESVEENLYNGYYFPYIDGFFILEYNSNFSTNNKKYFSDESKTSAQFNMETNLNINFYNFFSLNSKIIGGPFKKRNFEGNNYGNDFYNKPDYLNRRIYFNKYDFVFEELYLNFYNNDVQFGIGKFNPKYGLAYSYDKYIGSYGDIFANDYRQSEAIGAFVKINLPIFVLTFSNFFNDTSFLSNSVFGSRGRAKEKALVGYTNGISNFAISSEFSLNDYKINFAFKRLATNEENLRSEKDYLVGMEKVFNFYNGIIFIPFWEYNYAKNYNGLNKRNIHFATVNLPFIYENWSFLLGTSIKYDRDDFMKEDKTSRMFQFNIGYRLENGIMFDIAKIFGKEFKNFPNYDKKLSNSLDSWNFKISYILDFRKN